MKRTLLKLTLIIGICINLIACSSRAAEQNESTKVNEPSPSFTPQSTQPVGVSLIQLIANPEKYDGKLVNVIGYVHLEFEGNSIYLHRDDYKYGLAKNSLWLNVTEEIRKDSAKYNDKYVLVEGTFNSKNHGHMGMDSGAIENIRRFQVWAEIKGRHIVE